MIGITGATGFIGGHVARALVARGEKVRGLVRLGRESSLPEGVEAAVGDITDPASLERAFGGCESVYSIAAHYKLSGPRSLFRAANVDGARHVVEAAARAGAKRVVHMSSTGAGGPTQNGLPRLESDPPAPCSGSPYQVTKLEGEQAALLAGRSAKIDVIVMRPSAVFGPGTVAGRVHMFLEVANGKLPGYPGGGRHRANTVPVADVVDATLRAGERGRAGEIYNVCSDWNATNRELVDLFGELAGRPSLKRSIPGWLILGAGYADAVRAKVLRQDSDFLTSVRDFILVDWAVSNEKAKRELDFEPSDVRDAWRVMADWLATAGHWQRPTATA